MPCRCQSSALEMRLLWGWHTEENTSVYFTYNWDEPPPSN